VPAVYFIFGLVCVLLEKCSAVSVQYLTTCVLLGALDYAACEHLFDLIHQQIVFFHIADCA
jgi:hypothetical protein